MTHPELPTAPRPIGDYAPGIISGRLLFVSGQTPEISHASTAMPSLRGESDLSGGPAQSGQPALSGQPAQSGQPHPSEESDLSLARDGAAHAALNALSQALLLVDSLDSIARVVRLTGYVRSEASFGRHAEVINGASAVLRQFLPDSGPHARSAIGVVSLPRHAIVELDLVLELVEEQRPH